MFSFDIKNKANQQEDESHYYFVYLNKNRYPIPINSPYISDVDKRKYDSFLRYGKCRVRSNISDNVLQSFLNNWINQVPLDINYTNYHEYELLSEEFDRNKGTLEIFKRSIFLNQKNIEIKKQLHRQKSILNSEKEQFKKNIFLLFKYSHFSPDFTYIDLKKRINPNFTDERIDYLILLISEKVYINDTQYVLNKYDKTALIYKCYSKSDHIIFPDEIEYNSDKYKVIGINSNAFYSNRNVKWIEFSKSSPIQIIKEDALDNSEIKKITFPSSIKKIEEGINKLRSNIYYDIIECEQKNIVKYKGGIVLKTDDSDILLASACYGIPSCGKNIKRIASYAFCNKSPEMFSLTFDENSQLESIGIDSFLRCKLKSIIFPPSLIKIEYEAFRMTTLKEVYFPRNSKLKEIDDYAFADTKIEEIKFPSSLIKIGYGCFQFADLNSVLFADDSNLEIIKSNAFYNTYFPKFTIPKNIKQIGDEILSYNTILNEIEILTPNLPSVGNEIIRNNVSKVSILSSIIINNDKWKEYIFQSNDVSIIPKKVKNIKYIQNFLIVGKEEKKEYDVFSTTIIPNYNYFEEKEEEEEEYIDNDYLFTILYYSKKDVENVQIPSNIECISAYSFSNCQKLKKVEFNKDSNINTIENFAFRNSAIEELILPSSIINIQEYWCIDTLNLSSIKIIPKKRQNIAVIDNSILIGKSSKRSCNFDVIHFVSRNATFVYVPSFIESIDSSSFDNCTKIKKIEFEKESKLKIINDCQFKELNIKSIDIPKNVLSIGNHAFCQCKNLKYVNFENNSKLNSIKKDAFSNSSLKSIVLPSSVSYIDKYAFFDCKIIILEIGNGSKLKSLNDFLYNIGILMISHD